MIECNTGLLANRFSAFCGALQVLECPCDLSLIIIDRMFIELPKYSHSLLNCIIIVYFHSFLDCLFIVSHDYRLLWHDDSWLWYHSSWRLRDIYWRICHYWQRSSQRRQGICMYYPIHTYFISWSSHKAPCTKKYHNISCKFVENFIIKEGG